MCLMVFKLNFSRCIAKSGLSTGLSKPAIGLKGLGLESKFAKCENLNIPIPLLGLKTALQASPLPYLSKGEDGQADMADGQSNLTCWCKSFY
jgi:hypothetical protein